MLKTCKPIHIASSKRTFNYFPNEFSHRKGVFCQICQLETLQTELAKKEELKFGDWN